ncbi:hypothetical protein K488DRAFT_69990 [Vararia minispora EC-137]|uniref:Uncharacterized protein n=1 Tax=Vararia minispora EC-137 TaxID=1314806 RepID=A0ACB8QNP4_9AGAM|nr:hypothetical protein K488DRAFT_69990 [Vararia minispora EC-137]
MASSDVIRLYDLTRNIEDLAARPYSSNILRTRLVHPLYHLRAPLTHSLLRLALNIKGIAYKTVWLSAADIEPEAIKAGALPTSERAGKPVYTVPFVVDPSTGRAVSDSPKIAAYLDAQYPDTPTLGPSGSEAEVHAVELAGKVLGALRALFFTAVGPTLPQPTWAHIYKRFGAELEKLDSGPESRDAAIAAALQALAGIKGQVGRGPFIGGRQPSWADTMLAGNLWSLRIAFGEGSEIWKAIVEAHGGRWGAYMREFEERGWFSVA